MPSDNIMYSWSKENMGTVEKKSFQRRLQQKRPVDDRRVGIEELDNQKCSKGFQAEMHENTEENVKKYVSNVAGERTDRAFMN